MPARDTRNPGWFWADNIIVDEYLPKIGAYGLSLYILLCRHANPNGRAWPSLNTIAEKLQCSRTTVIKYLDLLKETGLIVVESQKTKSGGYDHNVYVLQDTPSTAGEQGVVQQVNKGSTAGEHKEDSIEEDSNTIQDSSDKSDTPPKEKKHAPHHCVYLAIAKGSFGLDHDQINGSGGKIGAITYGSKKHNVAGFMQIHYRNFTGQWSGFTSEQFEELSTLLAKAYQEFGNKRDDHGKSLTPPSDPVTIESMLLNYLKSNQPKVDPTGYYPGYEQPYTPLPKPIKLGVDDDEQF